MRNLRLLRNVRLQDSQFTETSRYCIVSVNDYGHSKSTHVHCFTFSSDLKVHRLHICNNIAEDCDLIADLNEHVNAQENVTVVGYTQLYNHLYIILSDGHFVIIFFGGDEVEVKHNRLHINPKHVSWSPDVDRAAIVNNDDVIYVLNVSDDGSKIVSEISLQNESKEQNTFINVGWGSIETQFRGSEGKYSLSNKLLNPVKEEICHDSTVNICWKQNSTAFAVTYFCKSAKIRKVKIFNQDGRLLNTTRDISGLFSSVDWCPSRNLITAVQQLPNKKVVCFIEQNALKHGDFQIADDTEVIQLRWNNNGSILACHGKYQRDETVTLWTTSNYKWYQKQCLVLSSRITYLQWDFDIPNRLHMIFETGIYCMYEWMFQVIESSQYNGDTNPCLVAVINDKYLNITPYRQICQPPSIPYTTYSASASINAIIFPNFCRNRDQMSDHSALLYLSNNKCALMTYENPLKDLYSFSFGDINTEIEFGTPLELSTWLWLLPNNLYFNWSRVDGNYFCFSHLDSETKSIVLKDMIRFGSPILALTNYESDVIAHTEDGALYMYHDDQCLPMNFSLMEPCFQLQALNSKMLVALSEHRNLYINESIKWRDILSFYWKPPFLVLIKMGCQLLITKVDVSGDDVKFNEVQTRQIEQKSHLITIVDDQVLLETERGNLEIIRPRPFSIFKMEQMLSNEKYYEVFRMLRKQRINLNVLFDHDPKSFLKNVKNVVEKVPDPMYLSTFVTELVDENVAKNMFPWKYSEVDVIKNKVGLICEALISSIKEYDLKKLINPLIAALVRQGKLTEAADYAIEHNEIANLCHLADPISVYRAALANYNITCALRIIEHSKLDPSEYLPFIHELQTTEENYRKFKICNYLEKYDEALKHLSECSDKFDECIAYVQKHSLYSIALDTFSKKYKSIKPADPKYVQVVIIVADYYFNKRMYEEAGVLYENADVHKKALQCYFATGDWLSAISTFSVMDEEKSETEFYQKLYDVLLKRRQYVDAAFVAFNSKNCKQAVDAFLIAKNYCSALNAAKGLHHKDIVEDTIRPHLITEVKSTIERLQSDKNNIESYTKILYHLREKIRTATEAMAEDDKLSVCSCSTLTTKKSTSSRSSTNSKSSTSSSTKELRKRERYLWNLRSGNPREELALLATVKESITVFQKLHSKLIPDLLKTLIRMGEIESARELKVGYTEFLKFLQETRDRIWSEDELKEEGGFKDISIRCPPDITSPDEIINLL